MVKYLFNTSKVAVLPPLRQVTTAAPHLHGLVDAEGAEKQSVHEGDGSACGGGKVYRAADDKGVRLCQFWCNFIDHIVKHAFACLSTFAAGNTTANVLVAHMEQLHFDVLGL